MTTRTSARATDAMDGRQAAEDVGSLGRRLVAVMAELPGDLDGAGDALAGAVRGMNATVASARDDSVLVGASLTAGLAIGLLVGGAPRILAAGAMIASVSLGAALLGRRPDRTRTRLATHAS